MSDDPFADLLGFDVVEQGSGHATVRAVVGRDHLNQHGTAHGGFVFALADAAFAIASNSHGPRAVALAATIHFTASAALDDVLSAEAREIALGRSAATYEVTVATGGQPVAVFVGTVHRRPD